jgi:hypothetical protein
VSSLPIGLAAAAGCGVFGARLGRAAGEGRATTITRGAIVAVGAIVVVEEVLGACGRLGAGAITLALAALCGLLAALARRAPRGPAPEPAPWTPLEAGLLAALVVALATRVWDGLHRTTFLYDALSYHLHAPVTWLHDRRLSIVPAVFGDPAPGYAPSNVELLFAFVLAPARSGALAQAVQAPLAGLACAALAAAVREAGGGRAAALGAALAFLLVPEVWQQSTSAMTDVGTAAFFLATLPFAVRLARRRARGPSRDDVSDAAALGLAAGLCAGSKVVGALDVAPVIAVGALLCARTGARAPRALSALLLGVAATGAFFYARNAVVAGNPLYPVALKLGTRTLAPGVYDAAALRASPYHLAPTLENLAAVMLEPGVAFTAGAVVAFALGVRRAPAWTLLAVGLGVIFWLVVPYQETRFLFPLWGVSALAMAAVGRARPVTATAVASWAPLALGVLGAAIDHPTSERWATLAAGALVGALAAWRWAAARAALAALVAALVVSALVPAPEPSYGLDEGLDDAWAWMRTNVRAARVAYTGNNLALPLAGEALANDVRYVNVAGAASELLHDFARLNPEACVGPEPAPYRARAHYKTWLSNLRATRREVLFVAAVYPSVRATIATDADGFPVERAWADAHPDVFTLRYASAAARVYGVAP